MLVRWRQLASVVALSACASAAIGSSAIARGTLETPEPRPGTRVKVSSYGDVTAYSVRLRSGRYRLVTATGDRRAVLAHVPTRRMPFDVDVGPAVDGTPVVVYSRCGSEPPAFDDEDGTTARWFRASNCLLYRYDPRRRRETALHAGKPSGSEFLPTIWRNQIAFVRRAGKRQPQVMRTRSNGRSPLALGGRLPGRTSENRHPESLDLRGGRLGIIWTHFDDGEQCPDDDDLRPLDTIHTYVLESVGDRLHQRAEGCTPTAEASRVSGGGYLDDGRLFWAAERYDLSGSLVSLARVVTRTREGVVCEGPEQKLAGGSLNSSTSFGTAVLANAGNSFVRFPACAR